MLCNRVVYRRFLKLINQLHHLLHVLFTLGKTLQMDIAKCQIAIGQQIARLQQIVAIDKTGINTVDQLLSLSQARLVVATRVFQL